MTLREWDTARVAATTVSLALLGAAIAVSGRPAMSAPPDAADLRIYNGGLARGWQDWSWASHELVSSQSPLEGKATLKMDPSGFNGVYLHTSGLDTTEYRALRFQINGGKTGGQQLMVGVADASGKFVTKVSVADFLPNHVIPALAWATAAVPLERLGAAGASITGIVFQDASGKDQSNLYLGDISLIGRGESAPQQCVITLDTREGRRPISPLIYGMASVGTEYLKDLRLGSNRWGGNPNTRYNWELGNCWNNARDWEFRNTDYNIKDAGANRLSGAADDFVAANRAAGVASIVTIPTIGWVAKDGRTETRSIGVPASGGPPISPGSDAVAAYDPAENRRRTSVRSFARKPGAFQDPPSLTDDAVYQDEWVHHLVTRFGSARQNGVRFYAMDNEPDLWHVTHTDVHPVAVSYDDILSNFLEYAEAVKSVDPAASITGPVSWGWTGYIHSPRDCSVKDFQGRPDRRAHGDTELIPWFLEQVKRHDEKTGKRTLDVLDVHYYPQATNVYSPASDAATNAVRLRSTRGLWDPTYSDESWIGEPVRLIPRMKEWISRFYPGTRLGITEWSWGAEGSMSGGLATAECLGIFGREGVDLANYWMKPPRQSPAYMAFKMFRNVDGTGAGFGDQTALAVSSTPHVLSCFGSVDSKTGAAILMVINKQTAREVSADVEVRHSGTIGTAECWRYSAEDTTRISHLPDAPVRDGKLAMSFPAYSITLLRFR